MGTSGKSKVGGHPSHAINAHLGDTGIALDLDLTPSNVSTSLQWVQKACDKAISDATAILGRLHTLAASDPTAKVLYDLLRLDVEAHPNPICMLGIPTALLSSLIG